MLYRIKFEIKALRLQLKSKPNKKFVQALNLHISKFLAAKYGRPAFAISSVFRFSAAMAAIVIIMLISGVGVYAQASPAVNETHPLYPIKRSIEDLREAVALTPVKRAEVKTNKAEERLKEVERLDKKDIVAVKALKDAGNDVREAIKLTRKIKKENDVKNIAAAANRLDEKRAEKIEKMMEKKNVKMRVGLENIVSDSDLEDFVDGLNDDATAEELDVVERGVNRRIKLMEKMIESDGADLTD
jgi:hypothetical protein